ncbi:MAG: FHA domain-containing protein [Pseudomonadales bacterium]
MNQTPPAIAVHMAETLAQSAAEQANRALALVQRLGLPIETSWLQGAMPLPVAAVHLLVLDRETATSQAELITQRFEHPTGEVLTLMLEPLAQLSRQLPLCCQERLLDLSRLSPEHQPLRVALGTLQLLDSAYITAANTTAEPATSMLPQSLLIRCEEREHRIPPDYGGLFTIGRGESCQLQIESTYASRLHGCFRVCDGAFTYRDMSSNGTRLLVAHDEHIVHDEEVALANVGALRIGGVEIRFEAISS